MSTTFYYDSCGQLSRQQFYALDLRMASGGLCVSHTVHGVEKHGIETTLNASVQANTSARPLQPIPCIVILYNWETQNHAV